MSDLYLQFISIATIHLFAVMSPGPDFIIIVRQSISRGRRSALMASLGIGIGILMHITLCIFGLGMIIKESDLLFKAIQIIGSLYLAYLGVISIISKDSYNNSNYKYKLHFNALQSFKLGFLTNILNPKATLFFLSLYTMIIANNTPFQFQILFGLWMSLATGLWFAFLSLILTNKSILPKIEFMTTKIQRITGIILIIFSIKLLFSIQ
tara:strand:+ start:959 stop:1585 length:627 start_codon:yes stop_codon:yes gene_type:complete